MISSAEIVSRTFSGLGTRWPRGRKGKGRSVDLMHTFPLAQSHHWNYPIGSITHSSGHHDALSPLRAASSNTKDQTSLGAGATSQSARPRHRPDLLPSRVFPCHLGFNPGVQLDFSRTSSLAQKSRTSRELSVHTHISCASQASCPTVIPTDSTTHHDIKAYLLDRVVLRQPDFSSGQGIQAGEARGRQ